jgi:hypothetical protein
VLKASYEAFFAYPCAIQSHDGKIHVVCTTDERTAILHAVFEESASSTSGTAPTSLDGPLPARRRVVF